MPGTNIITVLLPLLCTFLLVSTTIMKKSNGRTFSERSDVHVGRVRRSVSVNLTSWEIQELLDYHNELRGMESSSNMAKLSWNPILAEMSQEWAARCKWEHGNPSRDDAPYEGIGQNILFNTSTINFTNAIYAFYKEKEFYNYNTLGCSKQPCGHYTQVVWAYTKEVGCGLKFCPIISGVRDAYFLVCNYGPPGNYGGQKPFKIGRACSKCESGKSWCDNGLCRDDCTWSKPGCVCEAQCHNCAKYVHDDCACLCDVNWKGADCDEPCEDHDATCGANPGWPTQSWCHGKGFAREVFRRCPKFCGRCVSGPGNDTKCPVVGPGASSAPSMTTAGLMTDKGIMSTSGLLTSTNLLMTIATTAASPKGYLSPVAVLGATMLLNTFSIYPLYEKLF